MSIEEQDIARKIKDLQADATWLLHNQAILDARLERVENSLIFRTLRAIGRKWLRPAASSYAEWRKQNGSGPAPTMFVAPSLTLLSPHDNFRESVERVSTDYVAVASDQDQLHPTAMAHIATAQGADLIYTDEEQPDHPVFKPDWSPVLLRSVDYLGGLTAIRREHAIGHPDLASAARALRNPEVVHIPAVLYKSQTRTLPPPPVTAAPPAGQEQISIVVCTRNARLLQCCLSGIRARTDYPKIQLIVVQHLGFSSAEEEGAVERVIAAHDAMTVPYRAPFNFADMNNRGADAAHSPFLVFLNDDVDPLRTDWLRRLAHWLEDPGVGAAGAKLTFPDGALQHAGIAAWMTAGAWHPGRSGRPSPNWPWNHYTREVSAVTGACLAIRTADFRRLGGFDPLFPINFNDVDLCFRLQEAGLSVIVDMEAELRHDESRTRTTGASYDERRHFFRKWSHRLTRPDPFYSQHLAQNTEELLLR